MLPEAPPGTPRRFQLVERLEKLTRISSFRA
jgi:hypothetical protein